MTARTVLSDTLTDATSYSSGPLTVGDLTELCIDCTSSAVMYVSGHLRLVISRIGADMLPYELAHIAFHATPRSYSADLGEGLAWNSAEMARSFGDTLQIDLLCDTGNSVSASLSVKGK